MSARRPTVSRAAGVAAGLLGVLLAAAPGHAYPPGKTLTVGVADSPTSGSEYTVTASNVGPGCRVTFTDGRESRTVPSAGGTATVRLSAGAPGSYTVTALTSGCPYLETASTVVDVRKPETRQPQRPVGGKGKPPRRVLSAGKTVITAAGARTNAGRKIRTRVRCAPASPVLFGNARYCRVVSGPGGQVAVRTFGVPNLKVTVVQFAPGTARYAPYRRKTVYVNGVRTRLR